MIDWLTSWLGLFQQDLTLRIAITLLHFLWQGAAIGAAVVLLNRVLQASSASLRYLLNTNALLMLPLCAATTFTVVELPDAWRHAKTTELAFERAGNSYDQINKTDSTESVERTTELEDNDVVSPHAVSSSAVDVALRSDHQGPEGETTAVWNLRPSSSRQMLALIAVVAPAAVRIYFVVAGVLLLRLAMAMWAGHRLRSASNRLDESSLLNVVSVQARQVGLQLIPAVRCCERVAVPVVVGVLRPVILVPASLITGLAPEQFAAIMRHEMAHIRRYDLLINLLQRVVESLFFFHPAVWYLSRRMSCERENCCDDLVVSSGYQPVLYADALLRMAELCTTTRASDAIVVAASGRSRSQLETRIWRLVNMKCDARPQLTRAGSVLILLLTLAIVGMPAAVHSLAQEGKPMAIPSGANVSNKETEELSGSEITSPQGSENARSKGLDFLSDYIKLRELSLDMTEKQFLEIASHEDLSLKRSKDGPTYFIDTGDGHEVVVMFGDNGDTCSGIQRIRGGRGTPNAVGKRSPFIPFGRGKRRILATLDVKRDIKFAEVTLAEAVTIVGQTWHVSIVLDGPSLKAAGVTMNQPVRDVSLSNHTLRSALNAILSKLGLIFVIDDQGLMVTTKQAAGIESANEDLVGRSVWPLRGEAAKERVDRVRPKFGEIHQGLNLGLAVHGQRDIFTKGDWVALEFYIQNAGERTRTVEYWPPTANGRVFRVKDASGKQIPIGAVVFSFEQQPIRITLEPNEIYGAIEGVQIGSRADGRQRGPLWNDPRPGKYTAELPLDVIVSGHDDPTARHSVQLLSGKVDLEYSENELEKHRILRLEESRADPFATDKLEFPVPSATGQATASPTVSRTELLQGEWKYVSDEKNGDVGEDVEHATLVISGNIGMLRYAGSDRTLPIEFRFTEQDLTVHIPPLVIDGVTYYGSYEVTRDSLEYWLTNDQDQAGHSHDAGKSYTFRRLRRKRVSDERELQLTQTRPNSQLVPESGRTQSLLGAMGIVPVPRSPLNQPVFITGGNDHKPLANVRFVIRPYDTTTRKYAEPSQILTNEAGEALLQLYAGKYLYVIDSDSSLPFLRKRVSIEFNAKERLEINLQDPCRLELRAVDSDTGQGIAGVVFAKERPYAEFWAQGIFSQTLGTSLRYQPGKPLPENDEFKTDNDGYFRAGVADRYPWLYFVWTAPSGYKVVGMEEVELTTKPGMQVSHTFKLQREPARKANK